MIAIGSVDLHFYGTCVYAQQMNMMKMKTKMTMYGPLMSSVAISLVA